MTSIPFARRHELRKARRRLHQRKTAKLMRKLGGYNSFGWRMEVDRIRIRILRRIQFAQARKEAKASNAV